MSGPKRPGSGIDVEDRIEQPPAPKGFGFGIGLKVKKGVILERDGGFFFVEKFALPHKEPSQDAHIARLFDETLEVEAKQRAHELVQAKIGRYGSFKHQGSLSAREGVGSGYTVTGFSSEPPVEQGLMRIVETAVEHNLRAVRSAIESIGARLSTLESERDDARGLRTRLAFGLDALKPLRQTHTIIGDETAIAEHFARRPALAQLIAEASDQLRRLVEGAAATLEWCDDRLVVSIVTRLAVDVAEMRYRQFARDWWLDRVDVEDRTTLTLSYE
jgi:hypothetical protein